MRAIPNIQFPEAEHFAFFFEDTHLLLIVFERDARRLLFLIRESAGETVILDFPGDLYEAQVRDAIERIFFVDLAEEAHDPKRLVMGAYFPVGNDMYGAYYDRESDQRTLYFLRVTGEGEAIGLEAVEDPEEHRIVSEAFTDRYQGVFAIDV